MVCWPVFSGLYQSFKLGGCRSVVPSCTRSSRGVAAGSVSNLVSIGGSGSVWSSPGRPICPLVAEDQTARGVALLAFGAVGVVAVFGTAVVATRPGSAAVILHGGQGLMEERRRLIVG